MLAGGPGWAIGFPGGLHRYRPLVTVGAESLPGEEMARSIKDHKSPLIMTTRVAIVFNKRNVDEPGA